MPDTIGNAIIYLRERLNESGTTSGTWTDANLRRWLYEGTKDVSRRSLCNRDTVTVAATASVNEYTLSNNQVLQIDRVEWLPGGADPRKVPMVPKSYEAMDAVWWSYQDSRVGDPCYYTTWGFPPALKLKVYPAPPINSNFKLFVARLSNAFTYATSADDGLNVDLPEGWIDVAFDYAEYLALRRDRQWTAAGEVFRMYEAKINDMISMVNDYVDGNDEIMFEGAYGLPRWLVEDI